MANTAALEPGNISSLALGAKTLMGSKEVWVLVDTRVQKWDVKSEGWEEALLDEDVADIIRSLLRKTLGQSVSDDDANLDLELLDLAVDE